MVNISKELEKSLEQDVSKTYASSPDQVGAMIRSVFQNFTSNDSNLSAKAASAREALKKKFTEVFNSLVLLTVACYSTRTTPEEIEGKLLEIGADKGFIEVYKTNYSKFLEFMNSPEANTSELVAGNAPNQLLDFRWELRETLFDSESDVNKNDLVIGEFLYLNSWTGNMKKFRCLIPAEMVENISREVEQALNVFKEVKDGFN